MGWNPLRDLGEGVVSGAADALVALLLAPFRGALRVLEVFTLCLRQVVS